VAAAAAAAAAALHRVCGQSATLAPIICVGSAHVWPDVFVLTADTVCAPPSGLCVSCIQNVLMGEDTSTTTVLARAGAATPGMARSRHGCCTAHVVVGGAAIISKLSVA
jgi:hypothetical protein